jgi:hypothetical protein
MMFSIPGMLTFIITALGISKMILIIMNDSWHLNTYHNGTQYNDTQHNDTQHNDTQHNDMSIMSTSKITLSIMAQNKMTIS